MIQLFNRLQAEFGRILILVDVDRDSLIFRLPWWGEGGKEFEIGSWDMQVLERTSNATAELTPNCRLVQARVDGYVRDDAGNYIPRERAQEMWEHEQERQRRLRAIEAARKSLLDRLTQHPGLIEELISRHVAGRL